MTTPTVERVELDAPYAQQFRAFVDGAGREAPANVQAMRSAAFERFRALGFPTTKNEDWHFTSVAPLLEHDYLFVPSASGDVRPAALAPYLFGAHGWHTMVFVNGRFAPALSSLGALPPGVRVLDLPAAWEGAPDVLAQLGQTASTDAHAFTALNTAFLHDGVVVDVAADVEIETPIHVLFVTDANAARAMVHPRALYRLGRHARATIVESYVSLGDAVHLTNAMTEARLDRGATLDHVKIQREGMRAYHVGTMEVHQARDSHLVSFSFANGGALSRTNIYTTLDGEGCGATLNGLYVIDGEQHCDHQTLIVHAQPNTYSREVYKGVLDGRAHGVFNGKVYVHPEAQKTDGKQTNNVLLLSDTAQVDTKPQLEIFADDVKCTHGATVGRLDETALFYMKSRGVGRELAQQLLTYAFAADVLETIDQPEIRTALEQMTLQRFTATDG